MTATNHAITGALIGLSIGNPAVAIPLAFISHFALDAIPHYDQAEQDMAKRLGSKQFIYEQLILGAGLCLSLVIALAITHPRHWLVASVCAFAATSPDLFWIPRFVHVKRTGKDLLPSNWFLRFHHWIQWKTGPQLWWVEAAWYGIFGGILITRL
jgi:hypothetical protein